MPVPGLSLLGPKRIRGFVSILRYINPTIIIIIIISIDALCILSQSIYSINFSQFMTIENKIKLKFFFHVNA